MTDKRYPRCSAAGLLETTRMLNKPTVPSQRLYDRLGNARYQRAILTLDHNGSGWAPASVERYLAANAPHAGQD